MPGYISHTVMARDVYKKINNKHVNLEYMLTFSLGGDLCKYSKCRKASHKINQEEFIYCMADYLIKNNLEKDSELLGVLYGHICHYIMDKTIHPLVRKVDKECIKYKKNHTLIEGYYDNYLLQKVCGVSVDKYDNNLLFKGKVNNKVSNMINYAYKKIYDTNNVSMYYKFNLSLYKKIKYLYKIFGINILKKYSGFNKFILRNNNIDLFNNNEELRYKDSRKQECNYSLDTLYEKSVNESVKYIKNIEKYIGKKRNI